MKYHLLYDESLEDDEREELFSNTEELVSDRTPLAKNGQSDSLRGGPLLVYLSDEQIKDNWDHLVDRDAPVAFLPHPKAKQFVAGWGIDSKLKNEVKHLAESNAEGVEVDVLYVNEIPVFNYVVVGHEFQLTASYGSGIKGWWNRTVNMAKKFMRLRPFQLIVKPENDKSPIETAAAGMVITQHRKGAMLARMVNDKPSLRDGMMHVIIFCPRSLAQLLAFVLRSLWERNRAPDFGAHIKTEQISFEHHRNESGLEYAVDGVTLSAQTLALKVEHKQMKMVLCSKMPATEDNGSSEAVYRLKALPRGEAASAMAARRLPLLRRASYEEFKDLFSLLRDNARAKSTYLVLMVLSTTLATFGLFANSSPVVIGAMILAPLMAPIISLSMATLRQDKQMAIHSLKTIVLGMSLAFFFAVLITLITPIQQANTEILSRTRPNLLDLGVAVISGIAGAYALAREELAKTLAGVAIAVALVPPLAVSAIGLGWLDWDIFIGSALLLGTNLAGMVLAAAITFMLLGFSPLKLATKGVLISLGIVLVLCVPLGLGFKQMVDEHQIIQQIEGWESKTGVIKEVDVQQLKPLRIALKVVIDGPILEADITSLKKDMEARLGQPAELEITIATRR